MTAGRGWARSASLVASGVDVPGESDLRAVERRRLAAIVAGDPDALDELHAPEFVLCTPSGTLWTRRRYLDGLVDRSIRYHRFEPVTTIEVVVDARVAVLRYRSEIRISINGGAVGHLACWHLDVYQRDSAAWRCRWSQATDTIVT